MVKIGESPVELVAEPLSDQTGRRRVDRQLGEQVEQVDLAFRIPARDHVLDLGRDLLCVAAHELVFQGLVVEHLRAALGRRVEDDAFAEDRGHERIGLGLVELLLGGAEELLVGLGAR